MSKNIIEKKPFHEYDLHCHSFFSDAQHNFDVIINGLIEIGIKIIGFADHLFPGSIYFHKNDPEWFITNMYSKRRVLYRSKYLKYLDRKYPTIKILNGAEIDCLPNGKLTLPRGIKTSMFDYLSVVKHHTLPKPIIPLKRYPKWEEYLWKNSPYLKETKYMWMKGIQETFRRYNPDILCHPNSNMPKFMNEKEIRWFMANLKKYDVAYELNHFPEKIPIYQAQLILKYGRFYNVEFSLGSDFHGFTKDPNKIKEQLNHSQEMYEIAEKYSLKLLDPRKFLK